MFGFSDKSFFSRLILLLFVLVAGIILSSAIYMFIIFVQSGFDMDQFPELSTQVLQNTGMMRVLQMISSLCYFILPPFVLTYFYKENTSEYLSIKLPQPMQVFVAILSLVFAVPLINLLVTWNEGLHLPAFLNDVETWMRASENAAAKVTEKLLSGTAWTDLAANLVIIALMAGIGEELFFRGLLQRMVSDLFNGKKEVVSKNRLTWTNHATIWIIAFLFSAIHLQFYGFIPRLLLGAWFGYLLLWTGSIMVPIIAHFTNNALSTIFSFAENRGLLSVDPDIIGVNKTSWYSIISILLLACCIVLLKKSQKK